MKIYINQDEIEFTLEQEKNLGELCSSVEKWLAPRGFTITAIALDKEELNTDQRDQWRERGFDECEEIHFTALTLMELKAQNLTTLLHYCQMLQASLKEGNVTLLDELLAEYSYIQDSYEILLEDYSHTIRDHMASLLKINGFIPAGDKSEEMVRTVLEAFIMLEAVIQGRLDEISDPLRSGSECYDAIIGMMGDMEEVSVLLQTGKDKQAMDIIIRFTELFQKLLRIFTYLPQEMKESHGEDLKAYIGDMSGILKELTEAFTSEDTILMGDLMEYEILPRMKSFPRFFDSIQSRGDG